MLLRLNILPSLDHPRHYDAFCLSHQTIHCLYGRLMIIFGLCIATKSSMTGFALLTHSRHRAYIFVWS